MVFVARGVEAGVATAGADEGGAFEALVVGIAFFDVGFFDQAFDEGGVGLFGCFAYEACHGEVASHFDVFFEPEALFGETQAKFLGLAHFAREGATKGPAAFHVEAHGGQDVSLEAVGEVMEGRFEGEGASDTGEVADLVADGVPLTVSFFCCCFWWRPDRVTVYDERIEIDHLGVAM